MHCSDAARSVLQCQKAQEQCEGSALLHGGDLHSTPSSAAGTYTGTSALHSSTLRLKDRWVSGKHPQFSPPRCINYL